MKEYSLNHVVNLEIREYESSIVWFYFSDKTSLGIKCNNAEEAIDYLNQIKTLINPIPTPVYFKNLQKQQ